MNLTRRIRAVAGIAFGRPDRMHDRLKFSTSVTSAPSVEALRKLYSRRNSTTDITIEDRAFGGLMSNSVWLTRGDDEFQIPLGADESIQFPPAMSESGPFAAALIYKESPFESDGRAFNFSRMVRIHLPGKDKPLSDVRIEDVFDSADIGPERWWPKELESLSDDGQRMILRRGNEIKTDYGSRAHTRTFRLDLPTKTWTRIEA